MKRTILCLTLLILLMVPFLSACDTGDLDILVNYAKLWAMVHGIMEPDGSVNFGAGTRFAVGEAFGLGTTGDEEGDAVIDSARALNNMRMGQDEANQGWKQLYDGQDLNTKVIPHYNRAINLQPKDYTYYNERAIAQLWNYSEPTHEKDASSDFAKAEKLSIERPDTYLKMFNHRAERLEKLIQHDAEVNHAVPKVLYTELSRTYGRLASLTGQSRYTQLKQQVDTKLMEYQ
jgi:hypothetical protein